MLPVSRVTDFFTYCIREYIINPDNKSVRALMVLIALKYDITVQQKNQIRELIFSISPSFRTLLESKEFRLEMKHGKKGMLFTIESVVYMFTLLLCNR